LFDLGIQELIVIFVVALLVFGPKRLPELARTLGKAVGQFRSVISEVKTEVDREVHMAESDLDIRDLPAWKKKDEEPNSSEHPASEEHLEDSSSSEADIADMKAEEGEKPEQEADKQDG
jgi:Tat protein translocase TatB subunit